LKSASVQEVSQNLLFLCKGIKINIKLELLEDKAKKWIDFVEFLLLLD